MSAPDAAWEGIARGAREALNQLGYDIGPRCLPGEPDACGGGFAEHALAELAVLNAVTAHHLWHLGVRPGLANAPGRMVMGITLDAAAILDRDCEGHS